MSSQVPPGSPMSVNTPVNHVPPTSMSPPPEPLVQQTLSPPSIELSPPPSSPERRDTGVQMRRKGTIVEKKIVC